MKKNTLRLSILFLVMLLAGYFQLNAQERVLVFTKVGSENGFAHASIDEGVQMITDLGNENGLWVTDNTDDAAQFTTENLSNYAAVIWCNTSGDNILSSDQQQAFEDYIASGGSFVGIHAATDTYRDGSWPFYNELVGGIVQTGPNHTASDYEATMSVINTHPAVDFLGDTYAKVEEYYYWELNGGYLFPDNINILEVEATGDESYDAPRPISWYKEYLGGRSFYTALGHNESDYTTDTKFIRHIEEGIKYAIGNTLSLGTTLTQTKITLSPNPTPNTSKLVTSTPLENVQVFDINGRTINQFNFAGKNVTMFELGDSSWESGVYLIQVTTEEGLETLRLIKE